MTPAIRLSLSTFPWEICGLTVSVEVPWTTPQLHSDITGGYRSREPGAFTRNPRSDARGASRCEQAGILYGTELPFPHHLGNQPWPRHLRR